jgi:hypothetical protein
VETPADAILTAVQILPLEKTVGRKWLLVHQSEYDRADFNVRVGKGYDPGPTTADAYRKQNRDVSQRRIDIVLWQGTQPTIVELKDTIGVSAAAQLELYASLLPALFPGSQPAKLIVVGNSIGPDLQALYDSKGIKVFLV